MPLPCAFIRSLYGSRGAIGLVGAALFLVLAIAPSGCVERKRLTGPNQGDDFQLGPRTVYQVPPLSQATVANTVSDGTFVFPQGGGTLTVARILSGPSPTFPGSGFWVEYAGSSRIQWRTEDRPDEKELFLGYGVDLGSIDDETGRVPRWTAVPVVDTLGAGRSRMLLFEIIPPFDWSTGKAPAGTTHTGFSAYHLARLTPSSTSVQRYEAAERQAWAYFDTMVDSLPPPLNGYVATQVQSGAAYEPTFYQSLDHKYKGFIYLTTLAPFTRPMIFLSEVASEHTVAHEMGHFLTHILAADQKYLVLEAQAPAEHLPGDRHEGRSVMVEDYAHFTDYFCTGSILNGDPEEPWEFFDIFPSSSGLTPSGVDWPSLEGFGAVLLTSLVRQSPTIHANTGLTEDIPVVGAHFKDVLPLFTKGASNVNDLRGEVATFLANRGQAGLFPALAERIGWRYNAAGRIVDGAGQPLKDVRVQAICEAGGRLYRTPGSNTTGVDGRFSLSRVFPGESKLRLWRGSDSTDVSINAGWVRATNETYNTGDLAWGGSLLDQLHKTLWIEVKFMGEVSYSDGTTMGSFVPLYTFDQFTAAERPIWNGADFSLDYTRTFAGGLVRAVADGRMSEDGRRIETLVISTSYVSGPQSGGVSFDLRNLPVDETQEELIIFGAQGASIQGLMELPERYDTVQGQPPRTITGVNWASTADPPEIWVWFKTGVARMSPAG